MLKVRIYYAVLLAGCFSFFVFYSDYLAFMLFCVFAMLPIVLFIVNWIAVRKTTVKINLEGAVSEQNIGKPLRIVIDNESAFPIGEATLYLSYINEFSKETVFDTISVPVSSDNQTKINTNIISNHVGKIMVKVQKAVFYDLLKLTSITKRLTVKEKYYVLPITEKIYIGLNYKDAFDEESNMYSEKKANVNHSEIIDYHEYIPGDSIKKINWKLSSRMSSLMVKEFAEPISHAALVLYELSFNPQEKVSLEQVDLSLQVVCSIMHWLYENNIGHKLAWFSDASNMLTEVSIRSHEDRIAALQQIEDNEFYNEPKALANLLKGIKERSYSNIFYITSALNYETATMLADLNTYGKLNVIAIQEKSNVLEPSINELFHERDMHCIVITKNNLQQELQNLIA